MSHGAHRKPRPKKTTGLRRLATGLGLAAAAATGTALAGDLNVTPADTTWAAPDTPDDTTWGSPASDGDGDTGGSPSAGDGVDTAITPDDTTWAAPADTTW